MRTGFKWQRICVAILGFLTACSVLAQAYPNKPIRLVVPFPPGMNADVVKKINEAFNKVMSTPAVNDKLMAGGLEPIGGTPQQFARFIDSEITKWTKIAKQVGVKAE